MKTPEIKPDWNYGIFIGNETIAKNKTCIKCHCTYKYKENINMVFKNQLTKICSFCKKLK